MFDEFANGAVGLSVAAIIALIFWFVVNRASVRANEQIRLLKAMLDEQKQQNQLLRKLAEAQHTPEKVIEEKEDEPDFIRLIPER